MSVRSQFTEAELEAVRQAAGAAETRTAGEIVAVVVDRCESYRDTIWKSATTGALLAALVAAAVHTITAWWGGHAVIWILLPVCVGTVVGAGVVMVFPGVRRFFAGRETLARRVKRRAAVAFVEESVTETRDRTGVLVFVALFEHRVEILADVGLRDRVASDAWSAISGALADAVRRGRPGPALREAVAACGQVLVDAGVKPADDDANELADDVRLRDD